MSETMSATEARIIAEEKRAARAEEEYMTYYLIEGTDHVIEGDSGNSHVLDVQGSKAVDCSCPDREHQGVRCKHMAAYEEWLIDEIQMSCGDTIKL